MTTYLNSPVEPESIACPIKERTPTHFNVGDKVIIFIGESMEIPAKHQYKYHSGIVIGDAKKRGHVTVSCDKLITKNGMCCLTYNYKQPDIMLKEEYELYKEIFEEHPEKFKSWLETSPSEYNKSIIVQMVEKFK